MIIKAVKLYKNGFMTQFLAMAGEGADGLDPTVKYRSSLQNYLIDTGDEVILVDTGMAAEVPEQVPDEKTIIYMGRKIQTYVEALAALGYKPEQVSKILITHKHADHTGELRAFPNAKILAAREECKAALYANKLSIVFEDVAAARETLDRVRTFIRENPTVYLSTHTPLGYENLEAKAVVDLDNPPESKPVGEIQAAEATGKYICSVCGYVYDPAEHDGIAFENLPDDWRCPRCKQPKDKFNKA